VVDNFLCGSWLSLICAHSVLFFKFMALGINVNGKYFITKTGLAKYG
jgi:hypothetical protein